MSSTCSFQQIDNRISISISEIDNSQTCTLSFKAADSLLVTVKESELLNTINIIDLILYDDLVLHDALTL